MTYKEFKEKYNGKYTDFDGYYGHVLVRITTPTKITQSPLYEHGNY